MPRASKVPFRNRSESGWWIFDEVEQWVSNRQRRLTDQSRCLVWVNTRIVRAKNRAEAYRKAIALGRIGHPSKTRGGEWRFAGISMRGYCPAVGGVCQEALCGAGDGAALFIQLHASGRHEFAANPAPGSRYSSGFSLHILPKGFSKVRHYGLLGNRGREQRLEKVRAAILLAEAQRPSQRKNPVPLVTPSIEPLVRCPYCGSPRQRLLQVLARPRRRQPGADSS
jgi:hypothetical protein